MQKVTVRERFSMTTLLFYEKEKKVIVRIDFKFARPQRVYCIRVNKNGEIKCSPEKPFLSIRIREKLKEFPGFENYETSPKDVNVKGKTFSIYGNKGKLATKTYLASNEQILTIHRILKGFLSHDEIYNLKMEEFIMVQLGHNWSYSLTKKQIKLVRKFLREISQRKNRRVNLVKQTRNLMYLLDTAKSYRLYQKDFVAWGRCLALTDREKEELTLERLHDLFSERMNQWYHDQRLLRNGWGDEDYSYTPEVLDSPLEYEEPIIRKLEKVNEKLSEKGFSLALPDHTNVLLEWGNAMKHCIYTMYASEAIKKRCLLLGVFKKGELVYNIEIRGNQVRQFLGHCNSQPKEADNHEVREALKVECNWR